MTGLSDEILQKLLNAKDSDDDDFKKILDEMYQTYKIKNKKYGDSFNITHQLFGVSNGVARILEKTLRCVQIVLFDPDDDETLEDNLQDIANYCVMLIKNIRKFKNLRKPKNEELELRYSQYINEGD
ncbi:hypothetical protein HMPREF9706_00671 [Facklamia hominis CCUG 36813]|uniref:Nucleotide modification associated domain-containing protein n=2 Tax=Facklamia hominis TaxID=178214 RepID=K1LIK6_9LACT|nr:hypothetical protein HMPREF9706_00671 [Facklamia hominis CCUG 36813]